MDIAHDIKKKLQFDQISYNLLSYLETFDEVSEVEFFSKDGNLQSYDFAIWERKNNPFKLPSDLKAFYTVFNGLSLKWKVNIADQKILIGDFRLNSLDLIQRYSIDGNCFYNESVPPINVDTNMCTAFSIDNPSEYGQTIMVFRNKYFGDVYGSDSGINISSKTTSEPEIWFQDKACRLHFLTSTFTQYLRIAILHLGIIGWQFAYLPEGLPAYTQQWMRLFCKERLCIDIHWQKSKKSTSNTEIR